MQKQIPVVNEDKEHILDEVQCFALDMDGTIYLGEQWIDGAIDFLHRIEETGRSYVFVTNNSSKNATVYVDKLHRMGLDVGEDRIVTSGQATIYYLKKYFPGAKVFFWGIPCFRKSLHSQELRWRRRILMWWLRLLIHLWITRRCVRCAITSDRACLTWQRTRIITALRKRALFLMRGQSMRSSMLPPSAILTALSANPMRIS